MGHGQPGGGIQAKPSGRNGFQPDEGSGRHDEESGCVGGPKAGETADDEGAWRLRRGCAGGCHDHQKTGERKEETGGQIPGVHRLDEPPGRAERRQRQGKEVHQNDEQACGEAGGVKGGGKLLAFSHAGAHLQTVGTNTPRWQGADDLEADPAPSAELVAKERRSSQDYFLAVERAGRGSATGSQSV